MNLSIFFIFKFFIYTETSVSSSATAVESMMAANGPKAWILLVTTITAICLALVITVHKLNTDLEHARLENVQLLQGL